MPPLAPVKITFRCLDISLLCRSHSISATKPGHQTIASAVSQFTRQALVTHVAGSVNADDLVCVLKRLGGDLARARTLGERLQPSDSHNRWTEKRGPPNTRHQLLVSSRRHRGDAPRAG